MKLQVASTRYAGSLVSCRLDEGSWDTRISQHTNCGQYRQGLSDFEEMRECGVKPSSHTWVAALKACSTLKDLESARQIHAAAEGSGVELDVYVETMLVYVYAKCGNLVDARDVFQKMRQRTVVSWNAMIVGYAHLGQGQEALRLYTRMGKEGVTPNSRTFVAALKACCSLVALERSEVDRMAAKRQCLEQAKVIHAQAVKSGCASDVFVGTMLVDLYAKCGKLLDARGIFEKMPHRNVVSWTAMIWGYAQTGEGEEALKLYTMMQKKGVVPNGRTYLGALKACSSLAMAEEGKGTFKTHRRQLCLEHVKAIHSQVVNNCSAPDVFVRTMLVDVYSKCRSLVDARNVFDQMPIRNVVSWNTMIMGYVQMVEGEEALQLYAQMQQEGVVPDNRTFVAVLKACSALAGLEQGKNIHAQISGRGLAAGDIFLSTALIDMYCKCGGMEDAQQVFDELCVRSVVPWNALIAGYAHRGESEVVFHCVQDMLQEGIQPDSITFLSLLTVCGHAGQLDNGLKYFKAMSRDYGITPTSEHYTCIVDLLGRAGHMDKALDIVNTMPVEPKDELWRSVLGSCQKWANLKLGKQAFECAVRHVY